MYLITIPGQSSAELKMLKRNIDWTITDYSSDEADTEDCYDEILEDLKEIRLAIKKELARRWNYCSKGSPNENAIQTITPRL